MRPVGEIFLELEVLIDELVDQHDFQWGDILWWVLGHLKIHRPDAQEKYVAGGSPTFEYGFKPKKEKNGKRKI
jgi:hypothetical protein